MSEKVRIEEKFALINEHWRPKVVAELNGQEVKLVKIKGEFPWHQHDSEDEIFFAVRGTLRIEFRDRVVELSPGEFVVVPRGVEHRPVADEEVEVMLFEGVRNTGNIVDAVYTAPTGSEQL